MHKFIFKISSLGLAIAALFAWLGSDSGLSAGNSVLGMDDSSAWVAANSQDVKAFDLLETLNAGLLRVEIPWNEVEISPGAFTWSYQSETGYVDYSQLFSRLEKRGIEPVVVLSGGPAYLSSLYPDQPVLRESLLENYKNYVRAVVQQFGDQVDYWQIGDGINDPLEWGQVLFPGTEDASSAPDPQLYAQMLTSAYGIIKSAGVGDTVILGEMALGGDCADHPLFYLQSLDEEDAWYAFDAIDIGLPELNEAPENASIDTCDFAPVQSSGMDLTDSLRAIRDYVEETGSKPLWVDGLSFSDDFLAARAAERVTLLEVVEADYLTRASGLLLAYGSVDKIFWDYQPQSAQPGAIALQDYTNLAQTLSSNASIDSLADQGFKVLRFRNNGKMSLLTWRTQGGDEALPLVIPDVAGYKLYAFSADSTSMKTRDGIKMDVDAGGNIALLVSERPILISGRPSDLKNSMSMILEDNAAQASRGLETKFTGWLQVQKAKAADQVGNWVAEQQHSLMDVLRSSFQQWLRKSLGLAKQ
jgi:hypothetical protein